MLRVVRLAAAYFRTPYSPAQRLSPYPTNLHPALRRCPRPLPERAPEPPRLHGAFRGGLPRALCGGLLLVGLAFEEGDQPLSKGIVHRVLQHLLTVPRVRERDLQDLAD